MKKILSLFLVLTMVIFAFAGCKSQTEDETTAAEDTAVTDEAETKAEPVTETETEKEAEATEAKATETKKTAKPVDEKAEILKQAKKIDDVQHFGINFGFLNHDKNVFLSGDKSPYPKVEKYYLLKDYKTIADFKNKALSYYSKEVAYDNFFKYSENKADWELSYGPYMIEVDGRAYADVMRFGIATAIVYKPETVKVKSVNGSNAVIEVDYFYDREPEIIEKETFKMVKENGKWVFNELVR